MVSVIDQFGTVFNTKHLSFAEAYIVDLMKKGIRFSVRYV